MTNSQCQISNQFQSSNVKLFNFEIMILKLICNWKFVICHSLHGFKIIRNYSLFRKRPEHVFQ
jgi:hypothetical protein